MQEPAYYLIVISSVASISQLLFLQEFLKVHGQIIFWRSDDFFPPMLKDFRTELFISGRFLDSMPILFFGYIKMTPAKHKSYNLTTYLASRRYSLFNFNFRLHTVYIATTVKTVTNHQFFGVYKYGRPSKIINIKILATRFCKN